MPSSMLWKLQGATPDTFANAGAFAAALRQHLLYTPAGLTSVLLQIDQEQSAYVIQAGCPGCVAGAPAGGYCVPGCRVELLRRVLGVGYAEGRLSRVRQGLLDRPYTRAVVGWPASRHAQPLDASVLQGWKHARLHVHWRRRRGMEHGLQSSVVLQVGDGADDPLERLHSIGWRGVAASWLPPVFRKRLERPPRLMERPWHHDPYLLTPVTAATHWLMSPPARSATAHNTDEEAGYGNAATIVHHLHEAGARIEMLDLDPDGWKAQVAATTATGGNPRPVLEALRVPGAPLEVCDIDTGTLLLDPSQARPSMPTPPLLFVGVRPHGPRRWRPLSATHHLVLSGPIEGGVILGMLAPAMASQAVHVGVLDLTANAALAVALLDMPARLPTRDGHDPYELLGAIGSLTDKEHLTLVVLAADDAAAAESAMIPFLRAAMYRPVSVLLVVPDLEAIPAIIRHRCPLIQVRQRVAQWQVPEGKWEWAQPTVLRLPWRDPHRSWPSIPQGGSRPKAPLPSLDGFWAVPLELQATFDVASAPAVLNGVEAGPDAALPADATKSGASEGLEPVVPQAMREEELRVLGTRPPRRSRVYSLSVGADPDGHTATHVEPKAATSPAGGTLDCSHPPAQEPPMSAAAPQSRATPEPHQAAAPAPAHTPAPAPHLPALPGAASTSPNIAYTPRENSAGNLIVDHRLLALVLRWAEQVGQDDTGVPMTRFKSALHLPSKAHSLQLLEALRIRGLIRREVREGWYRLLTIEEAVRAGKLPPGPWYTANAEDRALDMPAVVDALHSEAQAAGVERHGEQADGLPVADGEVVT